jgi:hypothetical protein
MLETAQILAGAALVSLVMAIAAWMSPQGRLQLRRLDGAAANERRHIKVAAQLLFAAVGLSATAALLAITSWFAN